LSVNILLFSDKEIRLILSRLASIEAQQRIHTQMLQAVLTASAKHANFEMFELPEGVKLPLETIGDVHRLEQRLENMDTKTSLVNSY
jgi:hypothetical protein